MIKVKYKCYNPNKRCNVENEFIAELNIEVDLQKGVISNEIIYHKCKACGFRHRFELDCNEDRNFN